MSKTKGWIPWKRVWERLDEPLPRDQHGLTVRDTSRPSYTSAEPPNVHCILLLGDAGLGKTEELKRLEHAPATRPRHRVTLGVLTSVMDLRGILDRHWLRQWKDGEGELELLLDGLDEGVLSYPSLARALADELNDLPRERLWLRLTCRTAEVPPSIRQRLPELFPDYLELRLAPLTRDDVVMALEFAGLGATLAPTLLESQVAALTAHPITLLRLVESLNEGQMLKTAHEVMGLACTALLSESGARGDMVATRDLLAAPDRIVIARQLAAVAVLARKPIVVDTPDETGDDDRRVTVAQLASKEDSHEAVPATTAHILEVLGTPLFVSPDVDETPPKTWVWSHRVYQEFLASEYLRNRDLDPHAIVALLTARDSRGTAHVRPEFRELAAWLASDVRVFDMLMSIDPLLLVQTETVSSDETRRASLVRTLLQMSETSHPERVMSMVADFASLRHRELAATLQPVIGDGKSPMMTRWLAIQIASGAGCVDACVSLRVLVLRHTEALALRTSAARALREIRPQNEIDTFERVLAEPGDDEDDDLKGIALSVLWPRALTNETLFARLTLPRRANYFGAYRSFIEYYLPAHLDQGAVIPGLHWLVRHRDNWPSLAYPRRLHDAVLALAWTRVEESDVHRVLVDVLSFGMDSGDVPPIPTEVAELAERRRSILRELVVRVRRRHSIHYVAYCFPALFRDDDYQWMLDAMVVADGADSTSPAYNRDPLALSNLRSVVIDLLVLLAQRSGSNHAALLRASEGDGKTADLAREAKAKLAFVSGDGSVMARREREAEEAAREYAEKKRVRAEQHRSTIDELLRNVEAGDTQSWWKLSLQTCVDPETGGANELEAAPAELRGWSVLPEATRRRIVDTGEEYLRTADPATDTWLGTNILHRPAMAGYRALHLLYLDGEERLRRLEDDVWRRWAGSIVGAMLPSRPVDDPVRRTFIALAFERAYSEAKRVLFKILDSRTSEHDVDMELYDVDHILDGPLAADLIAWQATAGLKPRELAALFGHAVSRGNTSAIEAAVRALRPDDGGAMLAARLIERAPVVAGNVLRERLSALLAADEDWAVNVWTEYADRAMHQGAPVLAALGPTATAQAHVLLERRFPRDTDVRRDGAFLVSPRDALGMLRDSLLQQLETAGHVDAIAHVVRELGDSMNLGATLARAAEHSIARSAQALTVREVLALRGGCIFISYRSNDNAEGLVRAIFERLSGRLGEHRLFLDSPKTPAGVPWTAEITRALQTSRVVVAAIGPEWSSRLDAADDVLRWEVGYALRNGLRVVPVMLERGAWKGSVPSLGKLSLPAELAALAELQAAPTISTTNMDQTLPALVKAVLSVLKS